MKLHTTNYYNTFIEVAEDCPAISSEIPKSKGDQKTVAEIQYELLVRNPYKYTSDDIFFQVFANRNDLTKAEYKEVREEFFSKGQPCFRASQLTKRHGYGIHSDKNGKVALYGVESAEYSDLLNDSKNKTLKAMRNSKK